jgi:hypothetical protein
MARRRRIELLVRLEALKALTVLETNRESKAHPFRVPWDNRDDR